MKAKERFWEDVTWLTDDDDMAHAAGVLAMFSDAVPKIESEAIEAYRRSMDSRFEDLRLAVPELQVAILEALVSRLKRKAKTRGW